MTIDIVEAVREAMVRYERIADEIPNTVTFNTKYVSPTRRAKPAPEPTLFGMHIEFDDLVDDVLCLVGRRDPEEEILLDEEKRIATNLYEYYEGIRRGQTMMMEARDEQDQSDH
jgi:hypothetical protein